MGLEKKTKPVRLACRTSSYTPENESHARRTQHTTRLHSADARLHSADARRGSCSRFVSADDIPNFDARSGSILGLELRRGYQPLQDGRRVLYDRPLAGRSPGWT